MHDENSWARWEEREREPLTPTVPERGDYLADDGCSLVMKHTGITLVRLPNCDPSPSFRTTTILFNQLWTSFIEHWTSTTIPSFEHRFLGWSRINPLHPPPPCSKCLEDGGAFKAPCLPQRPPHDHHDNDSPTTFPSTPSLTTYKDIETYLLRYQYFQEPLWKPYYPHW